MAKLLFQVNKSWSKMTKVEKRKTLAQDVITQVKIGWLLPTKGKYCNYPPSYYKFNVEKLQKFLQQDSSCEVCAMGSLMASSIIRSNRFQGDWDDLDIIRRFKGIFSEAHLRLIEVAFEGKIIVNVDEFFLDEEYEYGYPIEDPVLNTAISFFKKFDNDKSRILAIMKNIIKDPEGLFLGFKK